MISISRRKIMAVGVIAAAASVLSFPAGAQTAATPATTKIVMPLPAGGAIDAFVRKMAESMAKHSGGNVIVDNKAGASGLIAVQNALASPADGSTLLYLHSGILMAQAITGRIDLLRDFKPIAKVSSTAHFLVVPASSPYRSLAELIKALKDNPGKLNFGSGGNGSPTHLMFEQMDEKTPGGLKATHIPFRGAVEGVVALMGGNIDFIFAPPASVMEQMRAGKVRALATTGKTRMAQLPNLPTMVESGITNYQEEPWGGFIVPAKTPDEQVARLATVIKAAMADPEVAGYVQRVGGKVELSASPAEFAGQIKDEIAVNKAMVTKLDLKPE